jgi:hypothetical protein
MNNLFLSAIFFASLFIVSSCTKKTDDPQPDPAPSIPVADANGLIESFTFQGNLNGTRRGTLTVSTTGNPVSLTANDRQNNPNSALFVPEGTDLRISGLPLPTGNASRTISCWIHANNQTAENKNFVRYGNSSNAFAESFGLSFNYGTRNIGGSIATYSYYAGYGGGTNYEAKYNSQLPRGANQCAWVHIALTYDQATNKLKLYVGGIMREEINANLATPANSDTLFIGEGLKSFYLDDLMIYNRALSDTEVSALRTNVPFCPTRPAPQVSKM